MFIPSEIKLHLTLHVLNSIGHIECMVSVNILIYMGRLTNRLIIISIQLQLHCLTYVVIDIYYDWHIQ